jgi:prophage tail gpP-like protein
MSKPTPGQRYTVVKTDTLWDIAAAAYGTGRKYTVIWDANKSTLRSGDPDLIYPGEVLWIPRDTERDKARLSLPSAAPISDPDPRKMIVVINDKEFTVESGNCFRAFDTAASGFTSVHRYDPDDPDHAKAFKPYQYQPCKCYLGGKLKVTGFVYTHDLGLSTRRSPVTVHGWSPTVDIVDCPSEPPFEVNNVYLENRIKDLIAPFGVGLSYEVARGSIFKRLKIGKEEMVFDHIDKIVRQRGHIVGDNPLGELVIHDADLDKEPIGLIEEGEAQARRWEAVFDGRQRFSRVKAYGSGPRKNRSEVALDKAISRARMKVVSANDSEGDTIREVAEAAVRKALENALTLQVPVGDWYTANGKMYEEGEIVTLVSKRFSIPDGFNFLIKEVDYSYDKKNRSATLTVTPPSVYSKEEFGDPWA